MNWDDLRFLVEIGREGTLAAAARRLKVDQTTVARRLRALEDTLGTPLFERSDKHWRPTAVGASVLERAVRIEEDVAGLARLAETGTRTVSGVGRITSLSASNDNLNVSRREADIAIRLARPESGDFLIRKLADVGFAVYAAPSAQHDDWVTYDAELAHTPEMRWLAAQLAGQRVRLQGWLHNLRRLGGVTFIVLRDGATGAQPRPVAAGSSRRPPPAPRRRRCRLAGRMLRGRCAGLSRLKRPRASGVSSGAQAPKV